MTRGLVQVVICVIALLSLAGSAIGQTCRPRDLRGPVALPHSGGSVAVTFFENSGCNWNGADDLNGTDGLVFNLAGVSGSKGTITGTLTPGRSLLYGRFTGRFLDANCAPSPAGKVVFDASLSDAPKSTPITIPAEATWLVIDGLEVGITNDATIFVHSDGADCETTPSRKRRRS